MFHHRVAQFVDGGSVEHIDGDGQRFSSFRLDLGGDFLDQIFAAACGNHIGSSFRQSQGQRAANSRSASNDDGDASRQIQRLEHNFLLYPERSRL